MNAKTATNVWDYSVSTDEVVTCPACGGEKMHPSKVRVNQGGQVMTTREGEYYRSVSKPSGRGTSIGVRFWCEECPAVHTFVLQFHKGRTFAGYIRDPDRICDEVEGLWRD